MVKFNYKKIEYESEITYQTSINTADG